MQPSSLTFPALILGAMAAPAAHAGGFVLHERSAAAQGASFAGADSGGDDVTCAGFNPAALGIVEGFEAGVNASAILFDVTTETANPFSLGEVSETPGQNSFVPAGALGYRVSEDFVVGLTAHAPFGLSTEYPNNALNGPGRAPASSPSSSTSSSPR